MNQFFRSRATRVVLPTLAAFAVTGSIVAAPVYAAVADNDVTATYAREGLGLKDVVPDDAGTYWPAGSHFLKMADGTELEVYCIDFTNSEIEKAGQYKAASWPAANLTAEDLAEVSDIVTRHASIGTPETKKGWEEAATQVAVWAVTNDVDYEDIPNAEFRDRVVEILDGANGTAKAPVLSYSIDGKKSVTGKGADAKSVVEAVVKSADGVPAAGQNLEFVVDGEKQVVKTDATGKAQVVLPKATESRTVAVNFTADVPAGVVFAPVSGMQPMIAATGFKVSDQISVKVDPLVADTPTTPAPKPKPAPKPVPAPTEVKKDPVPTEMPHTGGFPLVQGLLGAGALTAVGLWGRRKFGKR